MRRFGVLAQTAELLSHGTRIIAKVRTTLPSQKTLTLTYAKESQFLVYDS